MKIDIENFPKQFTQMWDMLERNPPALPNFEPDRIFFSGLGGSSLPADFVNDYLAGEPLLRIVRDYNWPDHATNKDLFFCASFSGNTEETLATFETAIKRKFPMVVLSHGGKLLAEAKHRGIPAIEIPECIQPRCAAGFFFSAILWVLSKMEIISDPHEELIDLRKFLEKNTARQQDLGMQIAKSIGEGVPIIYSPQSLESVARVIKIKFNENCKIQSFYNVYPELNHNEMVGYTNLRMKPVILHLQSQFMHPRIKKRMAVMKDILGKQINFFNIQLAGSNLLEELFDANRIGDYASYHLATSLGIDPAPVIMVEDFKQRLLG